MQGSYNKNGLPRPYYMKPKKKLSPYDKISKSYFTSVPRKLGGYLILLVLIGLCLHFIAQDLRPKPSPEYEIVRPDNVDNNIKKLTGSLESKADKEIENVDLAGNMAQNSKGQVGFGVVEAPKGGVANEAAVVGTDEDKIIGSGTRPEKGSNDVPVRRKEGNFDVSKQEILLKEDSVKDDTERI